MAINEKIDMVILCGGLGTRFRAVSNDTPKVMADVHGKPFLDILLEYYFRQGLKRFILCTGYMSDYIKNYYQKSKFSRHVLFSEEKKPMGTGGAVKNAERLISSANFLIMNGDSFCDIDVGSFIRFHLEIPGAQITIALTPQDERDDAGNVIINEATSLIQKFLEKKTKTEKCRVNAGIYLFNKKVLDMIPENQNYSLEYSLFPQLTNRGLYGYISNKKLIDIGTPERYAKALQFFKSQYTYS